EREESRLMHKKGVPVYFTPERGMKALCQLFRFDQDTRSGDAPHEAPPSPISGLMDAGEALSLLKKYRIPAVDAVPAASAREAAALAKKFGAPVVLKIASPDVAHKSDVGGVRLNLDKPAEVREAFDSIVANVRKKVSGAKIEGVTVSPMAKPGGLEVILGVVRDAQYGHALMFGLGGIFTEIYRDVQFCLLPAGEEEFRRMLRGVRGYPLLAGVRGQKPRDQKALIAVMKAVSKLVSEHPEIDQIDLNPVLVYEKGLSVVDVRIYSR
ncbi:MAG: acetate--CoA ligase family protein, partial [Deltaproteobacteria bacterium]|nr:acetate--CoA ligase family protein [Deltaproteobacteria bacterium]